MNQDIKQRWQKALRSGEYVQGRGALRSAKDEFCCLGVLCDLAAKEGLVEWGASITSYPTSASTIPFCVTSLTDPDDKEAGILPVVVSLWAGVPGVNPIIDDVPLSTHNDQLFKSFHEIADLIEAL